MMAAAAAAAVLLAGLVPAGAAERDIFGYQAQRSAPDSVTKIVFIGDAGTHGARGNHEFVAGFILMARALHDTYPDVHAVVHSSKNWPKDLSHADAIIVGLNHGERAGKDPEIGKATERGAGFMAVHFGVEVNIGLAGKNYLNWMGGYFELGWSVNPWWEPEFKAFSDHPTTRGLKPFTLRDEWYYHMRFAKDMKGVTPVLSAVAPVKTVSEKKSAAAAAATPMSSKQLAKARRSTWRGPMIVRLVAAGSASPACTCTRTIATTASAPACSTAPRGSPISRSRMEACPRRLQTRQPS